MLPALRAALLMPAARGVLRLPLPGPPPLAEVPAKDAPTLTDPASDLYGLLEGHGR